jgi:hypothetical protein
MKIEIASAVAAAAMLLATVMVAGPPAAADDLKEIDCSSSPFSFSGEGYHVDCEHGREQVRAGESSGATDIDVMTVSGEEPRMFITIVSMKINAPRIYLEHRDLRQSFRNTFSKIEVEEWEGKGNRNGYDSAEFKAEISGVPSWCIALQRYSNPAWTGYKRHVVGMGCSSVSRDTVYTALPKLRSPGD